MKTTLTRIALLLAVALVPLLGTSCRNTVHGAGQDVENAGYHIRKAVQD